MWKTFLKKLISLIAAWGFLFITGCAWAFNEDALTSALLSRIENGIGVGSVVGVIDGEQEALITVGYTSQLSKSALTDESLMNIGSLSKTFTGILLAEMVLKGEVKLGVPVENYLPEYVSVPSFKGQKITIRNLATHRSGLPSAPDNLQSTDVYNLWANYSTNNLYDFLATYKLTRAPGEKPEYSNTGLALLGHALEIIAGTPYEVLLKKRVLKPLGMHQTTLAVNKTHSVSNTTTGHNQLQKVVNNGVLTAFAPAGGIKSTGQDMMRFMKANMGIIKTPISEAIELSHQIQEEFSRGYSIGLSWFVKNNPNGIYLGHRGAISGYRSSIGFYKDKKIGVFVINNSFDKAWDTALAIEKNDIDAITQMPIKTVKVPQQLLTDYAGTYVFEDGEALIITAENGELFIQTPGQLKIRTLPVSSSEFVFTFVEGAIRFIVDENGHVSHLVLDQNGISKAVKIG